MAAYHTPVLLTNCMEALRIRHDGIYADATFGGGGHSREILGRITTGKLFAFDCDEDALKNRIDDSRFVLINQNFRELKFFLHKYGVTQIDGLLADLGVSSHQLDSPGRGFSSRFDSELDMRMDKRRNKLTAASLLNNYPENKLKEIFSRYGEIKNAGRLAKSIVIKGKQRIRTVNELKKAIEECVEKGNENQYCAKMFQALRIEVNDELNALKDLLLQADEMLKPGGRIAVISYHSLEDRLVKQFFRTGKFRGEAEKDLYGNVQRGLKMINAKPIVPGTDEIKQNSRARSAKLRVAEKET